MFETDPTNYRSEGSSFKSDNYRQSDNYNNRQTAEIFEDSAYKIREQRNDNAYYKAFNYMLDNPFSKTARQCFDVVQSEYQKNGWLGRDKKPLPNLLK